MTAQPTAPWRRRLFVWLATVAFLAPAVVLAVAVVQKAREAEPLVAELVDEAAGFGGSVTPESVFAVDDAPADIERPPGAVEQAALVDKGLIMFNGGPVDGDLFHPITIWAGAIAATLWAMGAMVVAATTSAPASGLALATVACLGALWAPLMYYRQVIDVVGYYVC